MITTETRFVNLCRLLSSDFESSSVFVIFIQSFRIEIGLLNAYWSTDEPTVSNQKPDENNTNDFLKNSQIQIMTLQTSLKLATLSLDFDSMHENETK